MISGKTILIAPLDWGLGHATRCVPLIQQLSENNTVLIGITPLNKLFFDQQFPLHEKIMLPSYNIRYSGIWPVWFKLLLQWPKITDVIRQEKKALEKIVDEKKINVVISDNRFGLYHGRAENIFITHQLNIQVPLFSRQANRINRGYIHQFDAVWVPDYEVEDQGLSGQLSDSAGINIPVKYIGPQSALAAVAADKNNEIIDYLILLSGAEPQRSILEKLLLEKFRSSPKKIVLVRGTQSALTLPQGNTRIINFASGRELKQLIVNADTVICRSGYSTLMDLHLLGKKKLILIPTPGQNEQEYLAKHWQKKFNATYVSQRSLRIKI